MAAHDGPTIDEENADTIDCNNGGNTEEMTEVKENDDHQDDTLVEVIDESIQEDKLMNVVSEVLEARKLTESRPLPVLVKGKEVDLLKLAVQVRACGGYEKVPMWSSISKSMGFGQEGGPLLKLVYVKYLKPLENRRLVAGQGGRSSNAIARTQNEDHNQIAMESAKTSTKGQGNSSSKKRRCSNTDEKSATENACVVEPPVIQTPISAAIPAEVNESLTGMLEWVKRLASNPGDPKKGHGSRVSRGNEALVEKYVTLARRARTILWKSAENAVNPRSESPVHSKKRARVRRLNNERGVWLLYPSRIIGSIHLKKLRSIGQSFTLILSFTIRGLISIR